MKRSLFSVALVAIMLFSGQLFAQDEESRWVDSVYNSLTMEQRVGQLICMRANNPDKPFEKLVGDYIKKYNIGGINEFSGKLLGTDFSLLKNHRYQGYAVGAGLAYGYAIPLATHWNLELEAGIGYVYSWYDMYQCKSCGAKLADNESHHYFGPTKAAVNIVYLF